MWFECKISYERAGESGVTKKVTETFLVEACSHAEAEINFSGEMKAFVSGDSEIVSMRKLKIAEMFTDSECADTWWWKARVSFITLDERTGTERRRMVTMMVQGDSIGDAVKVLYEGMKGTLADYEVIGLSKTNIMDVILHGKA